ncbi:MAG: HAD-IA family hydrolase [Actinomycetota bacterium]
MIKAVLFDFGGVITTSPFDAFARYERERGLPDGLIRSINATNPDDNAWAKLERSDVDADGFAELFAAEAAERGHDVSGHDVLDLLAGDIRPQMVAALHRIRDAGLTVACLTNNFRPRSDTDRTAGYRSEVMALFHAVVESSVVGVRKPEPEFYRIALETIGAEPANAVFLDDLGVNLKTARAMGMTTIKVVDPDEALRELGAIIGIDLVSAS